MALCACESTLDDLLRVTYAAIQSDGQPIHPTRGDAREVVGACLELTNPRARLSHTESRRREVSAIAELCWYLRGTNAAGPIVFYLRRYTENKEADGTIHGGYGPRLFGSGSGARVATVIEALKEHRDTRRTVVQIFDHADLGPTRYKDIPCTCTFQFLLRDDLLHMVVNMRSNDAYLGLPHDVFAFTMLQELVARSLDVDIGRYIHMVGSLHLYDENAAAVTAYLQEGWQSTLSPMPPMPDGDPWPSVAATLSAEAEIRQSAEAGEPIPFGQVLLPQDDYWADLVRVLGAWIAEKKLREPEHAAAIRSEVVNAGLREFI